MNHHPFSCLILLFSSIFQRLLLLFRVLSKLFFNLKIIKYLFKLKTKDRKLKTPTKQSEHLQMKNKKEREEEERILKINEKIDAEKQRKEIAERNKRSTRSIEINKHHLLQMVPITFSHYLICFFISN